MPSNSYEGLISRNSPRLAPTLRPRRRGPGRADTGWHHRPRGGRFLPRNGASNPARDTLCRTAAHCFPARLVRPWWRQRWVTAGWQGAAHRARRHPLEATPPGRRGTADCLRRARELLPASRYPAVGMAQSRRAGKVPSAPPVFRARPVRFELHTPSSLSVRTRRRLSTTGWADAWRKPTPDPQSCERGCCPRAPALWIAI